MAGQTSLPLSATPIRGSKRAELVFRGVDLAGPSYEARVYVNNPGADEATGTGAGSGYVGSFYVYAYGEPAPPGVAEARERGEPGPIAPVERRLKADADVLRAAAEASDAITVTAVPVPAGPDSATPEVIFQAVDLVVDRG